MNEVQNQHEQPDDPEFPAAVAQSEGPRNAAQEKASERIGARAERRAERKLPVQGSADDPNSETAEEASGEEATAE